MSQYGALGYAQAGWGYERILGALLPRHGARASFPRRRSACCSRSGSAAVADRLLEAVPGRRRPRQGAQAEARHADPRRGEAEAGCACRCASSRAPRRCSSTGRRTAARCIVHRAGRQAHDREPASARPLPARRRAAGDARRLAAEALRAQAVVARSYALATLKPGTLFDLYADTRSQVYGGIEAEAASTNRAIGSTAGRVLSGTAASRRPSTTRPRAGGPSPIDEVWPNATPVPYLVSVADPVRHALEAPPLGAVHGWTPAAVGRKLGVGVVRDLLVCARAVGTGGRGDAQERGPAPRRCSPRTSAAP